MPSEDAPTGECYINRLPVELLVAILEEHSVLELSAPFIDSQVCRRWHETTHLWPRVWSYITIRSTRQELPLNRIKTLLERSCDSPLHVNLEYIGWPLMKPSILLLLQHPVITRIQTLLLYFSLPDEIQMVGSMPNLRTLQLRQCESSVPTRLPLNIKMFPLLDELVIEAAMGFGYPVQATPLLLRTISLSRVSTIQWAELLLECRETLVEVSLHRCTPPPPAQIHLPNLKFLSLSYMRDSRNGIVAPSLITFHERFAHFDPLKPPSTFSSITEYACKGDFPSVGDAPPWGERVLPRLERLVLWGKGEGTRKVLCGLVSHPHSVPKLKTIGLARADGQDLSHDQWAELEELFAHTPLSSTLERRTGSRASYAPPRFFVVRDSSAVGIHIHAPSLDISLSLQNVNNITSNLVTRLVQCTAYSTNHKLSLLWRLSSLPLISRLGCKASINLSRGIELSPLSKCPIRKSTNATQPIISSESSTPLSKFTRSTTSQGEVTPKFSRSTSMSEPLSTPVIFASSCIARLIAIAASSRLTRPQVESRCSGMRSCRGGWPRLGLVHASTAGLSYSSHRILKASVLFSPWTPSLASGRS